MIALYFYFTKALPRLLRRDRHARHRFFFAAVSGNLVGMIGSSNNPISGLTLATTIVAALTMVIVGVKAWRSGRGAGVAAVGACPPRGGRDAAGPQGLPHPRRDAVEDARLATSSASSSRLVLFFPLYLLHSSDLAANPQNGGSAPQPLRAPGRPHGRAFPGIVARDGVAPRDRRHRDGISLILVKVRSRCSSRSDVPAARDDLRDLRGRLVRGFVDKQAANATTTRPEAGRERGVLTAPASSPAGAHGPVRAASSPSRPGRPPPTRASRSPSRRCPASARSPLARDPGDALPARLHGAPPLAKAGAPDDRPHPPPSCSGVIARGSVRPSHPLEDA